MAEKLVPLPCIICGFQPTAVAWDEQGSTQPYDAVECVAVGNYGSKEWDNLFGKVKDFNLCDKCFKEREHFMRERKVEVDDHDHKE